MPSFGYAIYDSNGLVIKASSDFLSQLGVWTLKSGVQIGSLLDSGPEEDDTLLLRPGEVWATLKQGRAKGQHVRLVIESLELGQDSCDSMFLAEIDAVEGGGQEPESVISSNTADLNFLTIVSHELRAPLNGIVGFAALLERSDLNTEQSAILQKMQSSNFLLKGLINDILEYSRIQSSRINLTSELVPLRAFVEEISGLFSERAKAKNLQLISKTDGEANISVHIPKLRVAQILTNLLSNAVKFTDRGKIVISCSVQEKPSGDNLAFIVEDTGPGIPLEDLPKIFEPFSQGRERSEPGMEGTGLGLTISRGLAEAMGGELKYRKGLSGGSAFSLEMPFIIAEELSEKESRDASFTVHTGDEIQGRSLKRVLVVEDNSLNAEVIFHFLKDFGVIFELADNGRKAVEMCRKNEYDLVLMDIMLPEMNGYEATEVILNSEEMVTKPIIIGVTAKVFRNDRLQCFKVGMKDVVHKPVDFVILKKVLEKHLWETEEISESEPVEKRISRKEPVHVPFDGEVAIEFAKRMSDTTEGRRAAIDRALESLTEMLSQIKESSKNQDSETLERNAHSMKGTAALIGARNISDLAKGLEHLASTNTDNLRAGHWIDLLENALQEVKMGTGTLDLSD